MAANSAPYQPWLHHQNHSSTRFIVRGMEIAIPPEQLPPRPSSHQYVSNDLPPLPTAVFPSRNPESGRNWETPIHGEMTNPSLNLPSISTTPQMASPLSQRTSRRYSKNPPKTPTMTKSSHKILQLTGFDARFEMTFPKEHQQINEPESSKHSNSSGSVYSQLGIDLNKDSENEERSRWSSSDSLPNTAQKDRGVLRSFYNLSPHMAGAISSVTSLRHRSTDQNEITTLREILAEEHEHYNVRVSQGFENDLGSQYRHELTGADIPNLLPRPLALRPKEMAKHISLDIKSGLLQKARDSLEWGINELALGKTKHCNTPTTPLFDEGNILPRKVPPPLKPRYKVFGTGNHPLKSPFPFDQQDVPETGSTFGKRLSGAIKHLSGGSSSISPKRSVISNGARRANGPDTPMPCQSGFMSFLPSVGTTMQKGGLHFQEVVTKAKKTVHFKNDDERKRESLKKSIVVVGISDQSPGTASMYYDRTNKTDFWQMDVSLSGSNDRSYVNFRKWKLNVNVPSLGIHLPKVLAFERMFGRWKGADIQSRDD
jgi:hypothetical protein